MATAERTTITNGSLAEYQFRVRSCPFPGRPAPSSASGSGTGESVPAEAVSAVTGTPRPDFETKCEATGHLFSFVLSVTECQILQGTRRAWPQPPPLFR